VYKTRKLYLQLLNSEIKDIVKVLQTKNDRVSMKVKSDLSLNDITEISLKKRIELSVVIKVKNHVHIEHKRTLTFKVFNKGVINP
jgi:hypothetical protein